MSNRPFVVTIRLPFALRVAANRRRGATGGEVYPVSGCSSGVTVAFELAHHDAGDGYSEPPRDRRRTRARAGRNHRVAHTADISFPGGVGNENLSAAFLL
jgi:hypothetical protein